jgi:hypothetical protein
MRIKNNLSILPRIEDKKPISPDEQKKPYSISDGFVSGRQNSLPSSLASSSLNLRHFTINMSEDAQNSEHKWWSARLENTILPTSFSQGAEEICIDKIKLFTILRSIASDKNYLMERII